jgi:hypothetical protein
MCRGTRGREEWNLQLKQESFGLGCGVKEKEGVCD